jgi:Na+/phosphate symporter
MADMIETMLEGALEVFRSDDRKRAAEISRMDGALDRLSVAVRHYLVNLAGEPMNEEDSVRSQEIFSFAINIEHIGDIIANNLLEFAAKKNATRTVVLRARSERDCLDAGSGCREFEAGSGGLPAGRRACSTAARGEKSVAVAYGE